MEFANILRLRREMKGLSQEEVAKAVGVARQTVTAWEGGQTERIEAHNIKKLAKALGVTPNDLLGVEDKEGA